MGIATALDRAGQATIDGCNAADLDTAVCSMIYYGGLPFNFSENPYFKQVLKVARSAPKNYEPPNRNAVGGNMLDIIYDKQMNRDFEELLKEAETYGLAISGDCATIRKAPLANALGS
ncbi:hypothetical protein THAOC_25552 [Thalassiosira oceanica]|uniref:Uncharacterized protein n=1 Tax=Thalassiosira oceanica TaxID=159749 RepID=K0S157_THAOC|nr:hypothetical protein THAOC_25552 [Thalassiosira oceanica]|eukprot:EJK54791.1 hypothetical protein THAOC_25552 [Thalassiosira oceanica]